MHWTMKMREWTVKRVLAVGVTLYSGLGFTICVRAVELEDIRSSQETVLEPINGQVEKVRSGVKVFLDGSEVLMSLGEEFLGRSFIQSNKNGVKVICRRAGHVYAVTASKGQQEPVLVTKGFKQLDYPDFDVFGEAGSKGVVYQKRVEVGETLEFGNWVLLIFGPDERGGVLYAKMRSLVPPAFLPDGSEFKTWEVPLTFSKTYHVDQKHPKASDGNPGTKDLPFKTINHAAGVLQPGERVVVGEGVYREWVCPQRGGTDPEHMISYEAEPGAKIVIKGSEPLRVKWAESTPWIQDSRTTRAEPVVKQVWMTRLPGDLFHGYNPFAIPNYRQVDQIPYWNLPQVFGEPRSRLYLQVRGLLFQDGKRLRQVSRYTNLFTTEGAFWVETNGLTIHISPYGGIDPNQTSWELTTREQIFAPTRYNLGYIRVKGFIMEHAGNSFPFPQRGAISTMHGHHWLIEENTLQWVNGVGIDIGDQGEPPSRQPEILGYHVLRRNTLRDIGITGITGPKPTGSLMEDNVFQRNAWHDVEMLAECAAIKTHTNLNVLVRRNLVFDTLHGTGIYMDMVNSNSRITQNVVVNTGSYNGPGPGTGGIYVEASLAPNMVDHNFVWGSTQTNGIYSFFITKLIVAHNLVGNNAGAGIMIRDAGGRSTGTRTIPAGGNKVFNNIFINNGWNTAFYDPNNSADYSLFGGTRHLSGFQLMDKDETLRLSEWRKTYGFDTHSAEVRIEAEFDPETLELTWSVQGEFAEGPLLEGFTRDFWNRPRTGKTASPGPFETIPRRTARIIVDPRLTGK
jgi:parallel beta helix pectate lyase-like protein